jgi:regulatory protein
MLDKLLYEKLAHFCEYAERCRYDVSKKCYALKIPKEEVPAYIEQLEKSGFLNETRYIRTFIDSHFTKKKWGAAKIRAALSSKGLKENQYKNLLKDIDQDDYYATALKLAEKKTTTIKSKSPQDHKAKLTRFLMSKGFEQEVIKRVHLSLIRRPSS